MSSVRTAGSTHTGHHRPAPWLPAALLVALDCEANRVNRIDEPATIISAVNTFMAAMEQELGRFGTIRLSAVAALRQQGTSYDRIAASTGLSKSRVAQLARPAANVRTSWVAPSGPDTRGRTP